MREQRKRLVGVVTSDKMDKTIVVAVSTTQRHPIYGKVVSRMKKYKAHDENNESHIGDRVMIIESRPYSREKRYALVSVLERAE
ncbi:MAG: 30S ribosomal protein S17 [Anaerolineales bacterium]|uniref:30S ribosomal protein S17 n=1 Tax=Promineifilum sp. TaxID=2664178 RepID=UPI001DC4D5EC|nr:30S ribosomal protein S17 [Anaerolineales bacterium]MCB8936275.1 30S ribosomal protein S17 [Promineifilum sp.]MCO5180194.1 30S ribosomal protein S17 [Promineifilum sp.]